MSIAPATVAQALLDAGADPTFAGLVAADAGIPDDAQLDEYVAALRESLPAAFASSTSPLGSPGGLDRGAALWRQHNNPKGTR